MRSTPTLEDSDQGEQDEQDEPPNPSSERVAPLRGDNTTNTFRRPAGVAPEHEQHKTHDETEHGQPLPGDDSYLNVKFTAFEAGHITEGEWRQIDKLDRRVRATRGAA